MAENDPGIQAFIAFCEDIGHTKGMRMGSEDLYMQIDEILDAKQPREALEQTLRCIGVISIPDTLDESL